MSAALEGMRLFGCRKCSFGVARGWQNNFGVQAIHEGSLCFFGVEPELLVFQCTVDYIPRSSTC